MNKFLALLICVLAASLTSVGCQSESPNETVSNGNANNHPYVPTQSADTKNEKTETDADDKDLSDPIPDGAEATDPYANIEQTIEIPKTWKRLGKYEIWADFVNKQVIVGGTVCMDMGPLEMFMCPVNTKEHESVVAAHASSRVVHGALLAIGSEPGRTAQWDPTYKPACGPAIDIQLTWFDHEKNKRVSQSGKSMVLNSRTRETMAEDWVFGGSILWEDPETKDQIYYGDAGEMVCLSNFSTATIDVNVESSEANGGLLYEANPDNIPEIGTKVYVILKPGKMIGKREPNDKGPIVERTGDTSDLPKKLNTDQPATTDHEKTDGE